MPEYGLVLSGARKKYLNATSHHCREDLQRLLNTQLYKNAKLKNKQVLFKIYIQDTKNKVEYLAWAKALTKAMLAELLPGKRNDFTVEEETKQTKIQKPVWYDVPNNWGGGTYRAIKYVSVFKEHYNVSVKMSAEILGNPFFASFYLGCLRHLSYSIRNKELVKQKPPSKVLAILAAIVKANAGKSFATPLVGEYKLKWKALVETSEAGAFDNLLHWRAAKGPYNDYSSIRGVNDWYHFVKKLKKERAAANKR